MSPFTTAETNAALEPAKKLRSLCYDRSPFAKAGQRVTLDFKLEVDPMGSVRAIPLLVEPLAPEISECVRHELNQIRFPARGRDRLDLHFEMGR